MDRAAKNVNMINNQVNVRKMTVEDIHRVYEIEQLSFSVPWTKESFYRELVHNHFATYLVIEYEGKVVGYCGLWVIVDDGQITNIAISPAYRGKKLGETLLRSVLNVAKEKGAKTVTLEVRVSNTVAQSLYKKLNFEPIGIRENYYTDNQEDAILMQVNL
ncbi:MULTISPECIES: ribosomal protein S18-alanine N-acetyltransferase [Aeribacillus]|jgi:[ribosomal protein S18]-alanine N-acetyltransferase|uniref:Ribosomal-protein-alanine N-acetyltransferase n=2 Tax=Aeribacillus TaxID=1055323 RepID=A0A165X550_9BACI|nr:MULTISPECIES: ribosomal protein S18-alanine N-acetyltransferase [Aeribacillus]ASS90006.1 ribosomal-protein-alanine N-acetyltransferase [Aeribacillus pallidus]KZM55980.1 ribosomal-protein-alanine N-acetyltransferase RimI [Aeribacillus pallidus]KZN95644.1 ribosomal-protein-alanine N-acetyltransferase RimI [Aeribacillus pallidus]MDR9794831.1 ribosomal protein S18-alanine N-acetyltransferase [Aeribacillus pallidus]MDR9797353.1 ribosomal protein S18-alanine N-acetyltransferase [Aeribacillus pall